MCQRCPKVFGIGELLPSVHSRLCIYSKTIIQYGEKELEVEMDGKVRKSIQGVKSKKKYSGS